MAKRSLSERSLIWIGIAVLIVLFLISWRAPSVTRHVEVTARAEVAGELVEGSAVMGLRWQTGDVGRMYNPFRSEAIVLDLNGRGTVYVLDMFIKNGGSTNVGYWHAVVKDIMGLAGNGNKKDFPKIRTFGGEHTVSDEIAPLNSWPLMVAFTDESRLETMYEVTPDSFESLFGPDVHFIGLSLAFTDESPTDTVRSRLPVLNRTNESYYTAFPQRDEAGKLIAHVDKAFPYKVGTSGFFERHY